MKIVFMGTPEFAVPSLEIINKDYEVVSVFTKIDKPNARGNKINYSPVKEYALANGLKIYQPQNFKGKEIIDEIRKIQPDLIVVVAYGKILPKEVIDIPKYGIINVHSSLLPKYRGAAPINAALINGDKKSGVSIMYVEEELDAGAVILQEETEITEEDTFLTLHDRLKNIGAVLLLKAIKLIENNKVEAKKQDEKLVSFVKPFKKEDCRVNWNKTSREIFNLVRGMNPVPTAFSSIEGKNLKIYSVIPYEKKYENSKNGEVVEFLKGKGVVIKTADNSVIITSAKPENKKQLSGVDLINGSFLKIGEVLC
ncbi:MAG: methionyl-tRNA formyltransferase [Fusobacterium gastrosuis]|uniref:methionyl-tRNA formyltransferase n=1 Tax=Fusobacterium gastrosuis TaxID=1755100 RepID=UPI002A9C3FE1|nr:methionyl-tRNA formyltransferase [Fusobacteriaceae bacterium]MDY5795211.1 methionyl-tRNA formyltransferase [Fusobacterium gastrosuis]